MFDVEVDQGQGDFTAISNDSVGAVLVVFIWWLICGWNLRSVERLRTS